MNAFLGVQNCQNYTINSKNLLFIGTSESSLPESPDDHFTHMKYHNFVYGGGQFWGTQNIYPVSPQYPLLNQYWPNTQQSQQQKVTFR